MSAESTPLWTVCSEGWGVSFTLPKDTTMRPKRVMQPVAADGLDAELLGLASLTRGELLVVAQRGTSEEHDHALSALFDEQLRLDCQDGRSKGRRYGEVIELLINGEKRRNALLIQQWASTAGERRLTVLAPVRVRSDLQLLIYIYSPTWNRELSLPGASGIELIRLPELRDLTEPAAGHLEWVRNTLREGRFDTLPAAAS